MTEEVTTTKTILDPITELLKFPGEILNTLTQFLGFNFTDLPQPIQILVMMFIFIWFMRWMRRSLFFWDLDFDWIGDIRLPKKKSFKKHKTNNLSFSDKIMLFLGLAKVKKVE